MKRILLSKGLLAPLFLLGALLFSGTASPQVFRQWARIYDSPIHDWESPGAMVTDDLGNVYVTGSQLKNNYTSEANYDYLTIKYSTSGIEEWIARYDGFNGQDYASAIAIDKAGNLYITGNSEGNGTKTDIVTIKYNNTGVQQWVTRFNGTGNSYDHAFAIKVDNHDNVYVVGYSETVIGSMPDYATIKYNGSGVQQWVRYHNGSSNGADLAYDMVVDTATSDIYITGITAYDGGGISGEDITTVKYNSAGVEQWVRDYKGGDVWAQDEERGIAIDGHGNVYVTGFTAVPPAPYFLASVTIKYDPSGNTQWITYYRGPGDIFANPAAIVADRFGNVYLTGSTGSGASTAFTIKYNSTGIQQWEQLYNGGSDMALDGDGNVYLLGASFTITKFSPEGTRKWVEFYDAGTGASVSAAAFAVNKFNDVFVTGSQLTNMNTREANYDFLTVKYLQPKPLLVTASPDTTINYGYGSNCVLLKAEVTGGVAPYSFTWSSGVFFPNNQSTFACPTATTAYTVIVKDALGTLDTAQVTIKVTDIRCGNQNEKITLCHNGKELCVPISAVSGHLQHGDKLGRCSAGTNDCDKFNDLFTSKGKFPFMFKAFPNPFNYISTVIYQIPIDAQVTITLLDLNGREISTLVKEKKRAGYYVAFVNARKLTQGTYLCKMVVSSPPCESVHTLKLIVVK